MDSLTKPLGVSAKKSGSKLSFINVKGFSFAAIPFEWLSVGVLGSALLTMLIWIAVVDDPTGGQPNVTVRVIEPKFDNKRRDVGLVAVNENRATLTPIDEPTGEIIEIVDSEEDLGPINPDEILIYDPSEQTRQTTALSLSTVADKLLVERSRYGFLPKVGANGEKPLNAYSRPAGALSAHKNQIAIIVDGLGLNEKTTQKAIAELPAEVTFAFAPYADGLFDWMERARSNGNELLMQIPLEPFDYPNNDPGPKTLLVEEKWENNLDRLHWLLSRMTNYVGVVNYLGARFSASPEALKPLFGELRKRGLLYVDNGSTPLSRAREVSRLTGVSYAQSSLVLDSLLNAEDIDARLLELESLAREKGLAIGIASAFPITIKRLKRWAEGAERRGIKLIPISASLKKSSS